MRPRPLARYSEGGHGGCPATWKRSYRDKEHPAYIEVETPGTRHPSSTPSITRYSKRDVHPPLTSTTKSYRRITSPHALRAGRMSIPTSRECVRTRNAHTLWRASVRRCPASIAATRPAAARTPRPSVAEIAGVGLRERPPHSRGDGGGSGRAVRRGRSRSGLPLV